MRTVLPGQSPRPLAVKKPADANLRVGHVPRPWYSKAYLSQVFAKRPAQILALLAFVIIIAILIYVFAGGTENASLTLCGSGGGQLGGGATCSGGAVQLQTQGTGGPISKIGQVTASSGSGSVTLSALPAGTNGSATLVAQVIARDTSAAISTPSGWSALGSSHDGSNIVQTVFRASGTGANLTWTATGASAMEVVLSSWSGVGSVSTAQTGASSSMSAVAVAPSAGSVASGSKVLSFFSSTAGPLPYVPNNGPNPHTGVLIGVSPNGAGNQSGTQAGIQSFENVIGRQVVFDHDYLGFDFSSLFPTSQTDHSSSLATAMTADRANGLLSYLTFGHSGVNSTDGGWPTPGGNGAHNSADTALAQIAGGQYDCTIVRNAIAMKSWGDPIILRVWHEMNQNMPWSELQAPASWSASTYTNNFVNSWIRVYTLTKGTDSQMAALSPAANTGSCSGLISGGHSVGATNVLFHWNPGKIDSGASVPQDNLYPGDQYVDFAGVEHYSAPAQNDTFSNVLGHSNSTYGSGTSHASKLLGLGSGEGGARCAPSGCVLSQTTQAYYFNSALPALSSPAFSTWKFLIYWDSAGPVGDNELETHNGGPQTSAVAAAKSWLSSSYMNPTLNNTWFEPSGVTDEYQLRRTLGSAHDNYGLTQLGAMMTSQSGSGGVTANSVGFGHWATLTVALQP